MSATPQNVLGKWVALTVNVLSSVALVIVNKRLFYSHKWHFSSALLIMHTLATFLVCWGAALCGAFEPKSLPRSPLIRLSCIAVASIVFMNLSLLHNALSTYQLSKLLIIPCTIAIQRFFYGIRYTWLTHASLLVISMGFVFASINIEETKATDSFAMINYLGAGFLITAVATSSLNQVWMNSLQKELEASPFQLIHQMSPYTVFLTAFITPIADYDLSNKSFFGFDYTTNLVGEIALSCVLAALLNISGYFVVGNFGAVTYQVVGHSKTIAIIACGFFPFSEVMKPAKIMGILISVLGMVLYTSVNAVVPTVPTESRPSSALADVPSVEERRDNSRADRENDDLRS